MALQLGFTWNEEPITFKPQPAAVSQPILNPKEIFALPEQLDFKSADPPLISIEKPQPMKFSNKPPSPKKIIQFQGVTKKKNWNGPQPNIIKKPKFSNFTNLSKDKLRGLGKKKEVKSHPKVAMKPQWNDNTGTMGLFDPVISKKIPIEIKHAIKNKSERPAEKITPPAVFQAWEDIPRTQSKSTKLSTSKKSADPILKQKEILIKENLDIRFIEDQESIIKKLEQQLDHEKKARRQLDSQFSEKMKELEGYKSLDKQIKIAKEQYIKQNQNPSPKNIRSTSVGRAIEPMVKKAPIQNFTQKPNIKEDIRAIRPKTEPPKLKKVTSEQLLSQIDVMKESLNEDEIILDRNGGNIFEIPTRDTSKPMIVKPPTDWNRAKSTTPELHNVKLNIKQENTPPLIEQRETFAAPIQRFEITDVRSKMDPLLNALSSTITRLNCSEKYGAHSGIGLISRVSAKYIAYYADSLSDLILDDILIDTVHDLQSIEKKVTNKNIKEFKSESEKFVEELVKDFHEETKALQEKYSKPIEKRKELALEEEEEEEDEIEIVIEKPKRFWNINIDERIIKSIKNYRREMQNYLEVYGGGSEGKLWEIYGFIGDEFVEEAVDSVLNDYLGVLDDFTDKVIGQEFM